MYLSDSIRNIYQSKGHSLRSWAQVVGVSFGTLSKAIHAGNMKVASLLRYLAPLGYQVALVPTGAKLPEGSYLIDVAGPKPEPEPYDLDDPDVLIG